MRKFSKVILITLIVFLLFLTGCTSEEKKLAISKFDDAVTEVERLNDELEVLIVESETLIQQNEKAFDDTAISTLESAVSHSKSQKTEIPDRPKDIEEILIEAEKLESVDYTEITEGLQQAKKAYEDSVKQYIQVTNPSESFVIERLENVEGITGISAVTEENDPNGNLGKAGSYTAQVFFTYNLVDQSNVFGDSIIEKGTLGGGSIEVYAIVKDAETRNDYLASFDGGFLATGSHTVVGTIVVRTSDELTASQQKELESKIIEAMIKLK